MRLAISARDAGSAFEAAAFIGSPAARRLPFEFALVGYGAAVPVLESTGLPVLRWPHAPAARTMAARRTARDLIQTIQPDALLVGLAYPGFGPDEALFEAASARGLPTAAVQDYWGHVGGFARGSAPDTFFVHDALAARLTRAKLGRRVGVVVTGSPRRLQSAVRRDGRVVPHTRRSPGRPLLSYFGQPASFPGCLENLQLFVRVLPRLDRSVRIRFRRHPGDDAPPELYSTLLARQPHAWECSDPQRPVEDDLLDADLVVTCHSSVGLDHHYLQLRTAAPLAPVLFVTVGEAVRRFLQEQVGMPQVPNVYLGLAAGITREADLAPTILKLLDDPSIAARYRKRITAQLATRKDPCAQVAHFFLSQAGHSLS